MTATGAPPPAGPLAGARIAIVHDYLTQRGGAERVVLALLAAFPQARLVTSVYAPGSTFPEFARYRVETSWLTRVPAFRQDPRRAFPLLAAAFASMRLDGVDLAVCSSSGWAHGVGGGVPRLVYCHNPARWLYQPEDYFSSLAPRARQLAAGLCSPLRPWDRRQARAAQVYVANSTVVQRRVERCYQRPCRVIPPPVTLTGDEPLEPVAGVAPGYLLTVGRARGYKRTQTVVAAMEHLPEHRLVVVGGGAETAGPAGPASARVRFLRQVSDAQMRWLYANCLAVVALAEEDFGLTVVEGFAFGRPAVTLGHGGYLDTMQEGVTGVLVARPAVEALVPAVRHLAAARLDPARIQDRARAFSLARFSAQMQAVAAELLAQQGHGRAPPRSAGAVGSPAPARA